MVQLKILSGARAGSIEPARQFPFLIGRIPQAGLTLAEPGVWDQHLRITLEGDTFHLHRLADALATVNGTPFQDHPLRNGDVIELGAVKLQFGLSETRQGNLRWRERLTWAALVALCLVQGWLMSRLTR
jgi:hypothetical protein